LPASSRLTLASGLFFFGAGVSLLAIGGTGIEAAAIMKRDLREAQTLLFLIILGLSLLAVGSATVAYAFKEDAMVKSDDSPSPNTR